MLSGRITRYAILFNIIVSFAFCFCFHLFSIDILVLSLFFICLWLNENLLILKSQLMLIDYEMNYILHWVVGTGE